MSEEYLCSDFYLACYLRAKYDLRVRDVRNEGSRRIFVFETNGKDIQEKVKSFYNDDDVVSANKFVREIKDLKTLMYNY